jgi:hypothetical protein
MQAEGLIDGEQIGSDKPRGGYWAFRIAAGGYVMLAGAQCGGRRDLMVPSHICTAMAGAGGRTYRADPDLPSTGGSPSD